jgi:hypothetical protein
MQGSSRLKGSSEVQMGSERVRLLQDKHMDRILFLFDMLYYPKDDLKKSSSLA